MRRKIQTVVLNTLLIFSSAAGFARSSDFEHDAWERVLTQSVNERGEVDYASLKRSPADLETYAAALAKDSPDSSPGLFPNRDAELAYWINAYNASVVKGVIDHYPTRSVRDIKRAYGFFLRLHYRLGERSFTLRALETMIRRRYQDPRVHFALNCASRGCPRLPQQVFNGLTLDRVLDEKVREFIADPEKVRIIGNKVEVSSIFKWYEKDFVQAVRAKRHQPSAGFLDYITLYAKPELAASFSGKKIGFLDYDWKLNDQK